MNLWYNRLNYNSLLKLKSTKNKALLYLVKLALEVLKDKQLENGLWDLKLLRNRDKDLSLWIALLICRIFKNFYGFQNTI